MRLDHITYYIGFGLTCMFIFFSPQSSFAAQPVSVSYDEGSPYVIDLIYFKGKMLRDQVVFYWMSAADTEPNGFSVEMKVNDQSWEKIGWVDAASESVNFVEYQFTFQDYMTGEYHFRLVQEDLFGVESYSNIISMHYTGQPNSLLAYTNPGKELLFFDGPPQGSVNRILLVDFAGNIIYETDKPAAGSNLPIAGIPSGQYMLECEFQGIRARTSVIF